MAIQIVSAVTSAAIIDDTIVNADINTAAAIDESKIASLVTDLAAKTAKATLTTKGDLYVASAASTPARLAVAADNTALLAPSSGAATGVAWSTGPTITGEFTARDLQVTGMTGAANPGRFVGVTASTAPTTGTFAVGDFVVTQTGNMFVCVTAGTPGAWTGPRDSSQMLTTGEETFPRGFFTSSAITQTSGQMRLTYFTAVKSETTTQARMYSGGTLAAATPTLCKMGLWTIAANGDGTLVASTANDTTLFAAATTAYTRSWVTPYAKVAGQRYAIGALVVSGTTMPTLAGSSITFGTEMFVAPVMAGTLGSLTDLGDFVAGSVTSTGFRPYMAILP